MAEWFVGRVMEKLIDTGFEYLEEQVRSQTGMEEELQRLRDIHPKIQAFASAYNQAHVRDENCALNKWMWQLRDAIDEADDLLDEFDYMKHKAQLAYNMEQTKVRPYITSSIYQYASKFRRVGDCDLGIDPNLERLEKVVQKLDKVSAEVGTFLHLLESTKQEQRELRLELLKTRETGSLPKNDLIGRGKDKEFVIQWLRKPSNEEHQTGLYKNISLLSIVGHGGMGKTTLLQHLYEDEIINEFDLKMWICVSNNFDVKRVIADMLESLTKNRPRLESSLDALQKSLKSEVISKKFLLVLDDIWEEGEDRSKWEDVLAPLAYGSLGSKILTTTRMDSVALMLAHVIRKKKETWRLEGLEEDECLQLLNTHAFADVENPDVHKKLRHITGEMVKKLFGSPLAAKVMGGVLNSCLDERHWTQVLNSDFRSAELSQNDIFRILKLSYIFLLKHLQSCFAFCCIFPQDHTFDKDDLVRMWIAVGFIQPSSIPGETMEDVGGRYFDILVKKSFFDKVGNEGYKMHDLLHELAQSVSVGECFIVVGDEEELLVKIPETIRHLSVCTGNPEVVRKTCKFKKLRTLCITYDSCNQDLPNALAEIFKVNRSIRLLHIKSKYLEIIPEEIEYLMHLRYFSIHFSNIRQLPRSLSNLYHLQFIKLPSIYSNVSDAFFPRDMNNLSNLHYLGFPKYQFPGIGKLKLLQKLNEFNVENENGYRVGELEHMNGLRILRINNLENVRDADEACSAKLYNKKNLTDLSLDWGIYGSSRQNIIDPDLDERVLDNLQPHNSLKKFSIKRYTSARFAIWMSKAHSISNLEHIQLVYCMELQTLPPFGHLPFLKSLILYDMPKAKWFDDKLEDWLDVGIRTEDDCLFPRLTGLFLKDCPKLQELPYLPPNLKKLMINKIGWKTLNFRSISKCIPLETLDIFHCPNITCIFPGGEICRLTTLREVKNLNCPKLTPFGGYQEVDTVENCQITHNDPSKLTSITSIRNIKIMDNNELVSFSFESERIELPFLSELHLEDLDNLVCLPSSLPSLSSLVSLTIIEVPHLRELPDLPPSLCTLLLKSLNNLDRLPSSLPSVSSLQELSICDVPKLRELQGLPPSLRTLSLKSLNNLDCLPSSLPSVSSLQELSICDVPKLRDLPNLPPSLCTLSLKSLNSLDCLPSSLPSVSFLQELSICDVSKLRELPNLPPSLKKLKIKDCHLELMKRYEEFSVSKYSL